ncbi:MAG: SDR family oxidoreductase [Actinobacteria bacterium]|nr:SDR family oxidoreductase [Actinomycetota bacterium]MCL6094818.1 SDR family oxidoreductase [Actinomycetota bacterium]
MRFENRVAVVTGGGSGIGRATSIFLAEEGAAVAVADLDSTRASQVAEEISSAGGKAIGVTCDVTSTSDVRSMVKKVMDTYGQIDILVSNAGWDKVMPFVDTNEEFWDKVIGVNYRGHLACVHAVLPHMIEREYGRIVLVASDAGRVGSSGETVYSGAKGATIAFSKAIAREVARYSINVNCVAPGLTDTAMLAAVREGNERLMDAITRSIPLRRVGKPEEVAKAICFMASPDADYITGQTLSVNGGLTMS